MTSALQSQPTSYQGISQKVYFEPLKSALSFVERRWPVLPLHTPLSFNQCSCNKKDCRSIGKHPRTFNGLKDASVDPDMIQWWWRQWPQANIGIVTGSQSKLVVIDVDPRHQGDKSWDVFCRENPVPPTLKSLSGGGGFHLFFRSEVAIKNKTGLLPGVDVRAEGGYIVAPGSLHASQAHYMWESDPKFDNITPLPVSIESLIVGGTSISKACQREHSIREGMRNSTLTSLAGVLRKHGLEVKGIEAALLSLNQSICDKPLETNEISKIAQSIGRYPQDVRKDIEWAALEALPSSEQKVPSLKESLIPDPLRTWILDISERMQVPPEFLAAPVFTSLSSIVGRQIGVFPKQKDDWFVVPNLWGAIIARPGFFKSPAIAEAMKPLDELVKKARVKFEAEKVIVKAKDELLKAKIDGLKDSIKKSARKGNEHELEELKNKLETLLKEIEENNICERRYKTNDATIEKLACLLNENPKGLLVLRDELSGWLKSMQKSGRESDREFYLEAWNGYGSFSVDRIGRGTLHVTALCLSIFGGLQPGKLDSYVNQATQGIGDDGLLQRFQLLIYPETPKKWRNVDRTPNTESFEEVKELYQRLALLKIKNQNTKTDKILGLHFSRQAQELFTEWRSDLESRLRSTDSQSPVFESHLAKYRSLVPSLALVFHLVENYKKESIDTEDVIETSSLRMALEWAQFLEAHARKVYSDALFPHSRAAKTLAIKIAQNQVRDKDSLRSIYRRHWAMLDSLDKLEAAIAILESANWVRVETVKIASTASEILRINPSLSSSELLTQFR